MNYSMKYNHGSCDILLIGYEDDENLGLRYIAAFLESRNIRVKIIPYRQSALVPVLRSIKKENPRLVGFSLIFQRMVNDFGRLIGYLRQRGVDTHFTMGGHYPTIRYREVLENIPGLDTIVRHEGEETLLDLYQNVGDPGRWHTIPGIAYRDGGEIVATPPRHLITDLDSLPFPVRAKKPRAFLGLGMASILTSRGCSHDCSFCSIRRFYSGAPGPLRRSRTPSNVIRELSGLYQKGIRIFNFRDDDFSMKGRSRVRWIQEFSDGLTRNGLADKIVWRISCRADEVDADRMEQLMAAGLGFLYLGIESGCNQGLTTCNKHYSERDVASTLGVIEKAGLSFDYGFMLLDPDTTFDSVRRNLKFFRILGKRGRVIVHFTKMLPYAGTPVEARLIREGRFYGPPSSPNYKYVDQRISLLERFIDQSFSGMLFDPRGLVYKFQYAQFSAVVLDRFFQDFCDTRSFGNSVRMLTEECNASVIRTLENAVKFMQHSEYPEICRDWDYLEELTGNELATQARILPDLDYLISAGMLS